MTALAGALNLGRSFAESRFSEQVKVGTLSQSTNPETFNTVETFTVVHTGMGRVKIGAGNLIDEFTASSQLADSTRAEVHLPISAAVHTGHIVEVLASLADPALVGMRLRLIGEPASGQVTAKRFQAEVIR